MEQVEKKKGLLERLLGSKVNTTGVSWKEKYLGHLIGPLGLILVVNTVAALVEKFFTQQSAILFQNNLLLLPEDYKIKHKLKKLFLIRK